MPENVLIPLPGFQLPGDFPWRVGFVGLVVPHAIRLVLGSSYRLILPMSLGFGAAFLILADLIARSVLAPAEIPIGVVTAFFGAPFFLLVLSRARRMT